MPSAAKGVVVENASDGGFFFWLVRYYLFGAIALCALLVAGTFGAWISLARSLHVPDLARYVLVAPAVTAIRAHDGTLLAELAHETRYPVPLERIPERVRQAFLAAEDRRFYEHRGLDLRGIVRAVLANLRAGRVTQGGSTITQQLAKAYLGPERTVARKLREAVLASRMESRCTKAQILGAYVNHVYLGHGAYGVQAAARRYFDKNVWALDLAESATIAGLAQAPSRDSPFRSLDRAHVRRDAVLDSMARAGFIAEAERDQAKAQPFRLRAPARPPSERSPWFAEHVRRDLVQRFGEDAVYRGGLEVETTDDVLLEAHAARSVDHVLRKLDKRQGWRGPEAHLDGAARDEFLRRAADLYGDTDLEEKRLYLALVDSVDPGRAEIRVGRRLYALPLSEASWAYPYSTYDPRNDYQVGSLTRVLRAGDVVWVRAAHVSRRARFEDFTYEPADKDGRPEPKWLAAFEGPPRGEFVLALEQTPRMQGVIYGFDHRTGYVHVMVGGHDFARSQFNRAVQSCRQPGSTIKPLYYSLALDDGFTYDSKLVDVPAPEVDPETGEVWMPQNLDGTVDVEVPLDFAFVWSKNIPSLQLFKKLGAERVAEWMRRLGVTTPIIADKALALGASCMRIDEMTRAMAILARDGQWISPVYVRRVRDRTGRVLLDHSVPDDPWLAPADRLDRVAARIGERARQAVPARAARLTSQLLRKAVTHGHAAVLRATGVPVAGKTGTSSRTADVWFVGYTSEWIFTAWVGDDMYERPLGRHEAAYTVAVPMFAHFIWPATRGRPLRETSWDEEPRAEAGGAPAVH